MKGFFFVVGCDPSGRPEELLSRGFLRETDARASVSEEERYGRYSAFPGRVAVCELEEIPWYLLPEVMLGGLAAVEYTLREVIDALRSVFDFMFSGAVYSIGPTDEELLLTLDEFLRGQGDAFLARINLARELAGGLPAASGPPT